MQKTEVIILYNRVFERYEIWDHRGAKVTARTFEQATQLVKDSVCLQEVYVNSRIGRSILARIGERK
jgi:hypothetical protein